MDRRNGNSTAPSEQILRELARILAAAVLRMRGRCPAAMQLGTADDSRVDPLEVSPDTVLSVGNPVNGPESRTLGALK